MALTGTVTEVVDAPADELFALVVNVGRLPEWNRIITRVVEHPGVVEVDAEWVVELKAMGNSWRSRSRVLTYDTVERRFAYRSRTDDGNPSCGDWTWQFAPESDACRVTVTWDLHPRTFWRRVLLAPVRNRQLRREVRDSVASLHGVLIGSPEAA
jgi:ribosome-associated toxin RatA of RatAB toxin-antitoxin module